MKSPKFLRWLAVGIFFIVGIMRLNDVSFYTPDSTLYLIYGNSLAHGKGMVDDTRPEPDRFVANAPLYAAILAPVELVFPKNLVAVKIWTLLWGCLALALLFRWLASLLGEWYAFAGVCVLALNPTFLCFSTEALSEAPFIVFLLICFNEIERFVRPSDATLGGAAPRQSRFDALGFIFIAALTPVLREVGFAAVGAYVVYLLLRRKFSLSAAVFVSAVVVFGVWHYRNNVLIGIPANGQGSNLSLIFRHIVTPASSNMFQEFMARIWLNGKAYFSLLGGLVFYPTFAYGGLDLAVHHSMIFNAFMAMFEVGGVAVTFLLLGLMLAGLFDDFSNSETALLRFLFLLFLAGILLIYPVFDMRFLLPAMPCLILYVFRGVRLALAQLPAPAHGSVVTAALLVVFLLPNASAVVDTLRTNLSFVNSPTAFYNSTNMMPAYYTWRMKGLGDWIKSNTPDDAVIASPLEDLAPWVGERKVLDLESKIPQPAFESMLRENNVTYILAPVRWEALRVYEFLMSESKKFRFSPVYSSGDELILRVESSFRPPADPSELTFTMDRFAVDTLSLSGLTRQARREFLKKDFASSIAHLYKARKINPSVPEPLYQLLVDAVMVGDSAAAFGFERELLTFPQTLTFSLLASDLLDALNQELQSKHAAFYQRKAVVGLNAAQLFWRNGYREHACELLDSCLGTRTDYFNGLLWAFHYNLQLGDTARARGRLAQLMAIDSSNALSKAFTKVLLIGDSINATNDYAVRSRMHLELAKLFHNIELNEEATDEAERAIGADPKNIHAYTFLALGYQEKLHARAALGLFREAHAADPANQQATTSIAALNAYLAMQ